MKLTRDESDHGGDRPGAGAAPGPKAGPPRPKTGTPSSADAFRRAGRRVTRRRIVRKKIRTRIRGTGTVRTQKLQALTAAASKMLRQETKAREALSVDRYELRTVEYTSSQPPSGNDNVRSAGTESHASGLSESPADVSLEFRSEMAALLAFYAARIGAVRRSLNRTTADVIILAIMSEQAVALRALTDRWHAASQRQRDERPERPTGDAQRRDEDARLL